MTDNTQPSIKPAEIMLFSPRLSDFGTSQTPTHSDDVSGTIMGFTLPRSDFSKVQPAVNVRGKNPIHPSALRAGDLTVGRTIVVYDKFHGTIGTFRILTRPFVATGKLQIRLRRLSNGDNLMVSLEMLGVIPTVYEWDDERELDWANTFAVDHRRRNLLPTYVPSGPIRFNPWLMVAFQMGGLLDSSAHSTPGSKDSGKSIPWRLFDEILKDL